MSKELSHTPAQLIQRWDIWSMEITFQRELPQWPCICAGCRRKDQLVNDVLLNKGMAGQARCQERKELRKSVNISKVFAVFTPAC